MFRQYLHKTPVRQHSTILTSDGNNYEPVAIPGSGSNAITRFFGQEMSKKFVVKRPRYYDQFGEYDQRKMQQIEQCLAAEYKKEQQVWNLVYPDNPAHLCTQGGLRLILPCLPGGTLTSMISRDKLTCCKQLLSVAVAVRHFHQLGFKYSDFNTDNVLLHELPDGSFRAYLIDFNCVLDINSPGGSQELLALNILAGCTYSREQFHSIDAFIHGITEKILTETKQVKSISR